MRLMKVLWAVAGAVVLAAGCNAAPVEGTEKNDSEVLAMEDTVSAMEGDDGGGGECPPPRCKAPCGPGGKKVLICHHAPPDEKGSDEKGSKEIELCIGAPGAEAHLEEHTKDECGPCKKK
jgi:hypothetical protein